MESIEHIVVILGNNLFHSNDGDLVWDPYARRVSNVVVVIGDNYSPQYYIGKLFS